jgi:uncharacterized protein
MTTKLNRLINEKSPYLLQHAYNPVDWYPWTEEAFEKAKKEDKPIFLSVGYSTCYWCHVMEREVFENDEIAKVMNELYINIKVDREERPDIDRVYMSALQSMTGSGGWPMSMFLTPELKPFYGATYIPPKAKYGSSGFEDVIIQIHNAWKTKRNDVTNVGNKIIRQIELYSKKENIETSLTEEILRKGSGQFKMEYDFDYGGFGGTPKFPRPPGLSFLYRAYIRFSDEELMQNITFTLEQMAKGGIYDHLGGGFHRYSVDKFWRIPHFEKMLYDQGQLALIYVDGFRITGENTFAETAKDILNYVMNNLTSPEGGFYSAEDAESALSFENPKVKEEGAFYEWEKNEIDEILEKTESDIFCYCYGVYEAGNAPAGSDPHNVFRNKNTLYQARSIDEVSLKFIKDETEIRNIISKCKEKLFKARETKPKPHLDDKILVSWNSLMISAIAAAYQTFRNKDYLKYSKNSADFIIEKLCKENYELLHRWRDGEAAIEGTLEDYSFFVQALIDLYEASFEEKYLIKAKSLADKMIEIFYDSKDNGFFDVSGKDKSILIKTKEDYDSAEPTGNSIAIMNLLRLSQFFHNESYSKLAEKSLSAFSAKMEKYPYSMPQMLSCLDYYLSNKKQIVISGDRENIITQRMIDEVQKRYLPNKILVYIDLNRQFENSDLQVWNIYSSFEPKGYVCEDYKCKLPVDNAEELIKQIANSKK